MQTAVNAVQDKLLGERDIPMKSESDPNPRGETMKALVWRGNTKVELVDAPKPVVSQPQDVIIKITGTTVCGSDLHLYHSEIPALKSGDVLGHEFMGVVEDLGNEVTHVKKGDRAVVSFQIACGDCRYCKQKLSSMCDNTNRSTLVQELWGAGDAGFFGYGHLTGGLNGGQAEYVRVPYGNVNLLKIPDKVPDEVALYLSDVLPTSYHAVYDTGVQKDDVVGIWGGGPIGLCVARWCQLFGAKRIILIDPNEYRREHALKVLSPLGPIEVVDAKDPQGVVKKVKSICPDDLDRCIDASTFHEPKGWSHTIQKSLMLETDSSEVPNEMIVLCRKMGSCGLIAAYASHTNGFMIGPLMEKGIRFIGNGQAPVHKYWETILNDYLIPGKFDPVKIMLSHRYRLEDIVEVYRKFDKREDNIEKVFLETRFSFPPAPGAPQLTRLS